MNILITGGFGFIGSNCAKQLYASGNNITIITRNKNLPKILEDIQHKIKIIYGQYDDEITLTKIIINTDIIIHAASTTVPENSMNNPVYDIESNVIPSIKLIQKACLHNIKKIIFISSGGVIYGNKTNELIAEDSLTNPISSYGITKLMIEKYLQLYNHTHGLNFVSLRISNAYGPNQIFKNNQGVISNWLNKIKNNQNIEIWGNGEIIRDYIYIDDLVTAIETSISKPVCGTYNIGSGQGISLNNLAALIIKISESNKQIIYQQIDRKFDVNTNVLDFSKFKKETGWLPQTSLADGIKKCILKS